MTCTWCSRARWASSSAAAPGSGDQLGRAGRRVCLVGLVPPHETTASGRALTACRVVRFDCRRIRESFEADPRFGYLMMEKMAQTVRQRLRDLRIEALHCLVA